MNVSKGEVRAVMKQDGWRNFRKLDYRLKCVANGAASRRETNMGLAC